MRQPKETVPLEQLEAQAVKLASEIKHLTTEIGQRVTRRAQAVKQLKSIDMRIVTIKRSERLT